MWIVQCLPAIESDMSVFHRVDHVYTMDGPEFFRRVPYLTVYNGAVANRQRQQQVRMTQVIPQEPDPELLWQQFRAKNYREYLQPGEVPRTLTGEEALRALGM